MTTLRKMWVPVLAAALLLGAPLRARAGQDRSPANDSSDQTREAPRAEPVEPAEPQASPAEPPSAAPSEPPSAPQAEPSAPDNPSGDDSSGRTAVPTGPDERGHGPSRQPPTRHGHGGGGGGSEEDGDTVAPADDPQLNWSGGPASAVPAVPSWHRGAHGGMGALDLDISPGRAQVFLNGQSIGTADDYDGWPRYLWLPPETYDLAFSLDGYQTLTRRITIVPGLVIDMDDRLQPGPP
jgi:hypothetical protein